MASSFKLTCTLLALLWWATLLHVHGEFIGWDGETYDPIKTWGKAAVFPGQAEVVEDDLPISSNQPSEVFDREALERTRTAEGIQHSQNDVQHEAETTQEADRWIEQLSWTPRSYLFHSFLTAAECAHVINVSRPLLRPSTVVNENGDNEVNSIRTSHGAFLPSGSDLSDCSEVKRLRDDVIRRIEEKVANWTHFPLSHQEDINVLRYSYQQKYETHLDLLSEQNLRFATVLMYLSDVEEGGETAFPLSDEWIDSTKADQSFSECAEGHVAGDALLFFSLKPDGGIDEMSFHTGCPVLKGIKWTATIWIRGKPFREDVLEEDTITVLDSDPGICEDLEKQCADWAYDGKCSESEDYMVRRCRLSCHLCKPCEAADHDCYAENRQKAGYPRIEDVY